MRENRQNVINLYVGFIWLIYFFMQPSIWFMTLHRNNLVVAVFVAKQMDQINYCVYYNSGQQSAKQYKGGFSTFKMFYIYLNAYFSHWLIGL